MRHVLVLVGNVSLLYHEYTLYMIVQIYCWHVPLLGLAPTFEPTTLLMSPAHHKPKRMSKCHPSSLYLDDHSKLLLVEQWLAPRLHMNIMSSNYAICMVLTEAQSGNEHTCWKFSGESQSM